MLKIDEIEYLSKHLSFYDKLSTIEKKDIELYSFVTEYKKNTKLYGGNKECLGLVLIKSGQLRSFISSNDGKEISLYRLLSLDICILSASCIIKNMNFDINVEAEKDSRVFVIPTDCFNRISESNIHVKNFALELVSARFSEVMWVFDNYVFSPVAKRLACFLLDTAGLEETNEINITHEFIANDLGTAREVVTRLLNHFAKDGIISLARGVITIKNRNALENNC